MCLYDDFTDIGKSKKIMIIKKEQAAGAIDNVVCEVFENMYFMFPEKIDSPEECFSFPIHCYLASIGLKGSAELFKLHGSTGLVTLMATNFLGKDPPFDDDELADIFKESGNVIVGNFLTMLNVDSSISIGVPVVETTQVMTAYSGIPENEELIFLIESEFLRVTLLNI